MNARIPLTLEARYSLRRNFKYRVLDFSLTYSLNLLKERGYVVEDLTAQWGRERCTQMNYNKPGTHGVRCMNPELRGS